MITVANLCYQRFLDDITINAELFFENVEEAIPQGDHLIINLIQVPGGNPLLGLDTINSCVLHVNVSTLRGQGQIKSLTIGQQVLNLFPKNLILQENPKITIDRIGEFGAGYIDGKWYRMPVKIPITFIKVGE